MSNIEEYTKNFKFMIPEFNVATWHTEIKENFKAIDALIANFVQSQQYQGAWKQVTSYIINDLVYISDEDSDYYGYLMRVKVNHTTTGDDFDTFLANNPTYYEVQGEMGAQIAALRAQDWAEKTDGMVIINEVPIDYSSKAYAIGGTGTETNNSKYFKEQAELARDTILEDPGFIVIKADFLGDETIKTVAENIAHVQNVNANLQSVVDVSTNIEDVNTLASNLAAILTNSENISSINTNATNMSDINDVSDNMSDVNNCSDNMAAILDAPNQAANAKQYAIGLPTEPQEGSARHWANIAMTETQLKPGMVVPFGGSTAPSGWLICDGSAISRTTYSDLFAVIGTTYGAGDGSTTFNIPNISSIVKSVNTNVPCNGNGLATGFMDGHGNYAAIRANPTYGASFAQDSYGRSVGASPSGSQFSNYIVGITSDYTKSGIVGTVTRSVLSINFAIKY